MTGTDKDRIKTAGQTDRHHRYIDLETHRQTLAVTYRQTDRQANKQFQVEERGWIGPLKNNPNTLAFS